MGWMMWIIVALVTVTFLFFGLRPSMDGGRTVAKVGGYVITADQVNRVYQNLYDNYKGILKDQFNDSMAKNLKSQALQELVVNRLLIEEAENMGLQVSDEELQAYIMQMPAFSQGGKFDKGAYDRILDRFNLSPAAFEADQREFLLRQKLENIVKDGVAVEDAELRAAYLQRNPKAKPGDYEKNKESFSQSYLAEKQRDALTAFLRNIQKRIPVQIEGKALVS